jgi:hypothetical protein
MPLLLFCYDVTMGKISLLRAENSWSSCVKIIWTAQCGLTKASLFKHPPASSPHAMRAWSSTISLIRMTIWLVNCADNFGICFVSCHWARSWPCEVGSKPVELLLENVCLDWVGRGKSMPTMQFLVGRESCPSCSAWRMRKSFSLRFAAWVADKNVGLGACFEI